MDFQNLIFGRRLPESLTLEEQATYLENEASRLKDKKKAALCKSAADDVRKLIKSGKREKAHDMLLIYSQTAEVTRQQELPKVAQEKVAAFFGNIFKGKNNG
jgi:hypothetical protein